MVSKKKKTARKGTRKIPLLRMASILCLLELVARLELRGTACGDADLFPCSRFLPVLPDLSTHWKVPKPSA
jgi:hypothetical protein